MNGVCVRLHRPASSSTGCTHPNTLVADHRIHSPPQGCAKPLQRLLRPEKWGIRHHDLHPRDAVQHPSHSVVLVSAHCHPAARAHQSADSDVQSMSGIAGEDHLLRRRNME